jgi:hypothetical protein
MNSLRRNLYSVVLRLLGEREMEEQQNEASCRALMWWGLPVIRHQVTK